MTASTSAAVYAGAFVVYALFVVSYSGVGPSAGRAAGWPRVGAFCDLRSLAASGRRQESVRGFAAQPQRCSECVELRAVGTA